MEWPEGVSGMGVGRRRQRGALSGVASGLSGLSSVGFKISLEAIEKGLP